MIHTISPRRLKFLLNLYGPYLGAGVRTEHVADDFSEIRVCMRLRWFNRNAVGTHFGGSLYAMVDPHLMLMLMRRLGRDYIVWDRSATIDFLRPGRGKVRAAMTIEPELEATIRARVEAGGKYLPEFIIRVVDEEAKLVAKVTKTIYVRKKERHR